MYFFILGHSPTLAVAEIAAVLEKDKIKFRSIELSSTVFIIDSPKIYPEKLMERLGGTIKIGEIAEELDSQELTPKIFLDLIPICDYGKTYFGLSLYPNQGKIKYQRIKELGLEIKKKLKEKGKRSRLVTSRDQALSSVVVVTNKLLKRGAEIVILNFGQKIYLGRTQAVQEFAQYSRRDYGRPARNAKSGLLPPKLAKMMLNLVQVEEKSTILDPFCGSGTILQEASLLGYKKIIGTDNDAKAIAATKKNFRWLKDNLQFEPYDLQLIQCDVKKLSSTIKINSIKAIITEPYLGPPLRGGESRAEIEKIIAELSELYLAALQEFKKVLTPGGRVVMIWPRFQKGQVSLDLIPAVKKLGFEIKNPCFKFHRPVLKITPRQSLIYSRPDQRLQREIFIFQK